MEEHKHPEDMWRHIQQVRDFPTMSRRQKSQYLTKELLATVCNLLDLSSIVFSALLLVPLQTLLQILQTLLLSMNYEQVQIVRRHSWLKTSQQAQQMNKISNRQHIYCYRERCENKPSGTTFCKNTKSSVFGEDIDRNPNNNKQEGCTRKGEFLEVRKDGKPIVIWPSTQFYTFQSIKKVRILRVDRECVTTYRKAIQQHQKLNTISLLSKWLYLDSYYIKTFKIQTHTSKQYVKGRRNFVLSSSYLYIICKGHLTLVQRATSELVLNQGSIVNIEQLLERKSQEEVKVNVQTTVYFFKISKQALWKLFDENPWLQQQLLTLAHTVIQFRSKVCQRRTLKPSQTITQSLELISPVSFSKIALERFRKTIGMKRFPNRFRVSSTEKQDLSTEYDKKSPGSQSSPINFVSSLYPFACMVQSQGKVAEKNSQGRESRQEINMLPEKDSKNFLAMKRRMRDEKIKRIRVKKRAQDEIREKKYFETGEAESRILESTLFQDHPKTRFGNQTTVGQNKNTKEFTSGLIKKLSHQYSQTLQQNLLGQQLKSLDKYRQTRQCRLPTRISQKLNRYNANNWTQRQSSRIEYTNNENMLNMSERTGDSSKIDKRLVNGYYHSELTKIAKMTSSKVRKIKISLR